MPHTEDSRKLGPGEKEIVTIDLGGVVKVTVRDGRIIRVRPLIFGAKDEASKSWSIRVGDLSFAPPRRVNVAHYALATRMRIYDQSRILHPLKREDFDPTSRDRKTERRGKSGYVQISWDEALSVIASEIKRIQTEHGPAAIAATGSSHMAWGLLNYRFSALNRFFKLLGHTEVFHNADSWEGWNWGAVHAYGFYSRLGIPDQYDLLEDALKNTEMIVYWSADPESTLCTYGGQESAIFRRWLKQLGKKQVLVDPFCNFTGVLYADKWLAPRPGTDAALALAIAQVWIAEGTYDKEYVKTHTVGFDEWARYVIGTDDGVPKTPEWASEIAGVPGRTTRALAREWASKRTMLAPGNRGGQGGACRTAYAHEWARMMVFLAAMQGYGKPGVNIWSTNTGVPINEEFSFPGYTQGGINMQGVARKSPVNPVKQKILRTLLPEAFLSSGPVRWRGEGFNGSSIDQQFKSYEYPLPYPDGARLRMLYRSGASYISTLPDGNRWVRMYQSPNMEFAVCQTPWFEQEARFADIVLPVCTSYERDDIGEFYNIAGYSRDSYVGVNHRTVVYQQKCIDPLGESKGDYEIFSMLAEKLGFGQDFTEGNSVDGWLRKMYEASEMPKKMTWEEFKKAGYYILPFPEDHRSRRAMSDFYDSGTGLASRTGKIEFHSQSLEEFDRNDKERPPVPRYISSWEGHTSELAKKHPLQLISVHPRYSFHTQYDSKGTWLNEIPHQRVLKDGYYWWPLQVNPADAGTRGIQTGDIVKVFNDRGTVLCIAEVTERIRRGAVRSQASSSAYDPLEPGVPGSIDKGGCINLLTSNRMMSKNASGFAPGSCLVEIAKWDGSRR
jgi:molybdopterin guanine dinucleotide-containing S/N-oxide reductase-like protein